VPEKAPSKDLLDKRAALKAKLQVHNSDTRDTNCRRHGARGHFYSLTHTSACILSLSCLLCPSLALSRGLCVSAAQEKQTHLKVVIDKLRGMQNDIAVLSCAANTYDN
jgi:hypothetical protein